VTFRPASTGEVVVDGDLQMFGSNAIFRGSKSPYNFRIGRNLQSVASPGALTSHHVVFENLDGAGFQINPNHHITIKGGDWGPNYICGSDPGVAENKIGPDGNIPNQWPHDIVLDGLYVHDQNSYDLSTCHFGGLFLISGYNLTIQNSVFSQNVTYDILIQDFSNPVCCGQKFGQWHDVVIQNNWFGSPTEGLAPHGQGDTVAIRQPDLQFDESQGPWRNWLIRYNSFSNGPDFASAGETPVFENVRVIGNVGRQPQCFAGASGLRWAYNAWVTGRCSSFDVPVTRLPYVSTQVGAENYHLVRGTRAQNLIKTKGKDVRIMTDIDGETRPWQNGRDAGSDERQP
jgi:hypothetical protein